MAISKLPTDFVDDIINTDISDRRRYNMINNSDGTISLEDVTTYRVIGSEFGAEQVNQTNGAVNELIDGLEKAEKSADKDFILINQQALSFVQNVATIQDQRIMSDSLADVYFTSDTIDIAQAAGIEVDTIKGGVSLRALRTPTGQIRATIHIRVV